VEKLERGQIVQDALARIPARCRRMLQMLFFEDPPRPYDEVAAELGLARGPSDSFAEDAWTSSRRY
jgi:DNA-directed RNA polymerase specialized sigma24 family protein